MPAKSQTSKISRPLGKKPGKPRRPREERPMDQPSGEKEWDTTGTGTQTGGGSGPP